MSASVQLRCRRAVLDNGLRVFVHERRTMPLVAVNLWYHVGSRNERPGRTGLAHLFEHLMFEGSANVPAGRYDVELEAVGGVNNGSTSADRTNYWVTLPSHALELALWLESDRMGWLPPAISQEKLDAQRDVVKNERRQSYENRPYGLAWERLHELLYPEGHPYRWPVIGSMEDLDAATLDDVLAFFATYYAPNNASLAVAGDVAADRVFELVAKWFGDVPRGRTDPPAVNAPPVLLDAPARGVLDDAVHLPRVYLAWHSPAAFAPGDAELDMAAHVLAHGRASRLHRALVHDLELARDVDAFQYSGHMGSTFNVVATARPGVAADALEAALRDELAKIASGGFNQAETERARNVIMTSFVDALETVGGFGGRADRLNLYEFHTGDPDFAERDFARFMEPTADDVAAAVVRWITGVHDAVLHVVPRGGSHA